MNPYAPRTSGTTCPRDLCDGWGYVADPADRRFALECPCRTCPRCSERTMPLPVEYQPKQCAGCDERDRRDRERVPAGVELDVEGYAGGLVARCDALEEAEARRLEWLERT